MPQRHKTHSQHHHCNYRMLYIISTPQKRLALHHIIMRFLMQLPPNKTHFMKLQKKNLCAVSFSGGLERGMKRLKYIMIAFIWPVVWLRINYQFVAYPVTIGVYRESESDTASLSVLRNYDGKYELSCNQEEKKYLCRASFRNNWRKRGMITHPIPISG